MNTNKNSYTFIYASIVVIIVAFLLAFVSSALHNRQQRNIDLDKMKQVLASLNVRDVKDAEAETTVEFEKVLLVDNDGAVTVGTPIVEGAKVVCEVVNPLVKGDKVLVFHKKRKKGYKKLNGHRQQFTELAIKEVIA